LCLQDGELLALLHHALTHSVDCSATGGALANLHREDGTSDKSNCGRKCEHRCVATPPRCLHGRRLSRHHVGASLDELTAALSAETRVVGDRSAAVRAAAGANLNRVFGHFDWAAGSLLSSCWSDLTAVVNRVAV
jgi:hypothetical protein